jgi:uncharacterized protein YdeI (YjbR/CyaY-like superfamily)
MGTKIKAVDDYIRQAQPFAQPVLTYARELVHTACPEVVEVIKWGFPNFEYKGPLCSMAAFKAHCGFTFNKASLMKDPHQVFNPVGKTAMGSLGKLTSIADLPSKKIIIQYLHEAMAINEKGTKIPKIKASGEHLHKIEIPEDFLKALAKNKKAKTVFDAFSPSHVKEYVNWITEAKREETRKKRIETAVEWIADKKGKNWKYETNK